MQGARSLLKDRTSEKPAQGLNAMIVLECLLWALPKTSTGRSFEGPSRTSINWFKFMVHAENSLLKVLVASDAQCMGMEIAIWMVWLREPPEGRACQQKKEVGQSTAVEKTLPALTSGLPYICERR